VFVVLLLLPPPRDQLSFGPYDISPPCTAVPTAFLGFRFGFFFCLTVGPVWIVDLPAKEDPPLFPFRIDSRAILVHKVFPTIFSFVGGLVNVA